eukprot:Lankesteria_metandrocarpae@DN624_c0_g1_i1.p1
MIHRLVYVLLAAANVYILFQFYIQFQLHQNGEVNYQFEVPFYIYDIPEMEPAFECALRSEQRSTFNLGEVYAYTQLKHHPWRVYNPEKALLFVVPLYPGMMGQCKLQISHAMRAIAELPFYKRNMGWDHLLVGDYWYTRFFVGELIPEFANFTLGGMGCFSLTSFRCTVTIPKTSQTVPRDPFPGPLSATVEDFLSQKKFNLFFQGRTEVRPSYKVRRKALTELHDILVPSLIATVDTITDIRTDVSVHHKCQVDAFDAVVPLEGGSTAFDLYTLTNGYSINPDSTWATQPPPVVPSTTELSESHLATHEAAVGGLSELRQLPLSLEKYASYNMFYRSHPDIHNALYRTTGCVNEKSAAEFASAMRKSVFNLHLRGDDFTSSRLYDALSSGVPSVIVANNIYTCGLPFSCMVPWRKMTIPVDELEFLKDPSAAVNNTVQQYLPSVDTTGQFSRKDERYTRLQSVLSTINRYLQDVLWEVPHSRVATNLLVDTVRKCVPEDILKVHGLTKDSYQCPYEDESYDCDQFGDAVKDMQLVY